MRSLRLLKFDGLASHEFLRRPRISINPLLQYVPDPNSSTQADRDRALFDTIASAHQEKDLRLSSRAARQQRLRQTVADFAQTLPGQALLEVGCGAGFSVDYLNGGYRSYLGVDHSPELIDYAKQHFSEADFVCCDSLELKMREQFDGIFMVGVLHHMEHPYAQLEALYSFLKPGGWIALNEPNSANPFIQLLRWLRKGSDETYSCEQRTYRSRELEAELSAVGFEDVSTKAQGIFSTPFAEVPLRPDGFWAGVARVAVRMDIFLEARAPRFLRYLSWNLVATARKQK
jgi:2-polyprenyl-3-methyl-5-hydroxy-6-metoxy-1,4-benzoquinol methylase